MIDMWTYKINTLSWQQEKYNKNRIFIIILVQNTKEMM